jgi:sigma-B regulation protein RsbU (phosphoserine phosphatase)
MWVGVFDAESRTLRYVDAGHSYALLQRSDGAIEQLDKGGGLPIGVEDDITYSTETVTIGPGDRVMVVSDGIIEQFNGVQADLSRMREQFDVKGMQAALSSAGADEVADLFAAVVKHAGSNQLSDDATAVLVKWK